MTPDDVLTYDGTTQPISEWALDYGIPASLIIERLQDGQSVEAAITTMMLFDAGTTQKAKGNPRSMVLTHNGLSLTIKEWAERIGVAESTIHNRRQAGQPIDRVLRPLSFKRQLYHTHNGESLTVPQWADRLGVSPSMIYQRLRKYGTVERRDRRDNCWRYEFDGLSLTLLEWSARLAISASTLAYRLKSGWTIKRTLTTPTSAQRHRGVVFNFPPLEGTGAGSVAQDRPEITFPTDEASR